MRILAQNKKKKEIKLLPESQDDLWCLRNLIQEGDRISSLIYRESKIPMDKLRPKKAEKIHIKAKIRVIKVEFQEFSDRMRIFGVIEEAPQDLGKYHTINLDLEHPSTLTLIKEEWKDSHLKLLKDAIERSRLPLVMIVALDEEEATLAFLRSYGIQLIGVIHSHRSGKQYPSQPSDEQKYYGSIIQRISQLKEAISPLLVVGPGFAKEKLLNRIKEKRPELLDNYLVRAAGERGMPGIQEAIKKGFVAQVQKRSRISMETSLVEKLLVEIVKDRYAAYGYEATKDSIERGAGRILLVASDLLHEERIQDLMELASKIGCKVHLVSTFHEAGKKLTALGGIGAILRY